MKTLWLLLLTVPALAAELHVGPAGDDANPGTEASPLRTIQAAAARLQPGDVCRVLPGAYRETVRPTNSGRAARPIRFEAAGDGVLLSGVDPLTGWVGSGPGVSRAKCAEDPQQVFCDGVLLHESRWPNAKPGELCDAPWAKAGEGTNYDQLVVPDLQGDWTGATIVIQPGDRWTNATRTVTACGPGGTLKFDKDFRRDKQDQYHQHDPYEPRAGNPFWLFGARAGLDAPGEWYWDQAAGELLVIPPAGKSLPDATITVKRRDLAFDLHGLTAIQVVGFEIHGAGVNLTDAVGCLVENCRVSYPDSMRVVGGGYQRGGCPNQVSGRDNVWRHSLITATAATALQITGEDNRVEDCILYECDYSGGNYGALSIRRSVGTVVDHCSIFRTGRALIEHGGAKRIRLTYNDLHHANLLTNDTGATYAWGTDGEGSVIAHNWVHDNNCVGIYLDNFDANFIVHHNLIWNCMAHNGITLNSDALSHLVANNTIYNDRVIGTFTYYNRVPTMKDTRILNNLTLGRLDPKDPRQLVQGELAPLLSHNGLGAIDARGVPIEGSAAVDAGEPIQGVTDGFEGRAPDLGAYERGGEYWTAGATWGNVATVPNVAFQPAPPLNDQTMVTDGLAAWFDASDTQSIVMKDGPPVLWKDRSSHGRDVVVGEGWTLVKDALGQRSVMRSAGQSRLVIGDVRVEPGAMSLFLVAAGPQAAGQGWQRIAASTTGVGDEWVKPNWTIVRQGGAKPEAFPPKIFYLVDAGHATLANVCIAGASENPTQYFAGDIAEVLLFDRRLRFDESSAIETWLRKKWGITD